MSKEVKVINEVEYMEYKEELRKDNVEELRRKKKSVDSSICRLRKREYKKDEMDCLLIKGRGIVEVISEKLERKNVWYERSEDDIKILCYEEVVKGMNSLYSILCIERGKLGKFRNDEKIVKCEKVMEYLKERKKEVEGNRNGVVKVDDIMRKLEDIKDIEDLKKWLVEKSKIEE